MWKGIETKTSHQHESCSARPALPAAHGAAGALAAGSACAQGPLDRGCSAKGRAEAKEFISFQKVWTVTKDSGERGRGCSHLPGMLHCGGSGSRRPRPKAGRGRRAFPEVLRGAGASPRKPTATALCGRGQSRTAREDPPGGFSLPRCQSEGES